MLQSDSLWNDEKISVYSTKSKMYTNSQTRFLFTFWLKFIGRIGWNSILKRKYIPRFWTT